MAMRMRGMCLLAFVAAPLTAQGFPAVDSLLARRDTTAAIRALETLIARDWENAEARWRLGTLFMSRHVEGTDLSPNRRRAEEQFRYATRFAPDSAKYWLALAMLFRGEDWAFTRSQVPNLVNRAVEAAERSRDTAGLAEAYFEAGRAEFERWEHFGNRWEALGGVGRLQDITLQTDWGVVENYFTSQARAVPEAGRSAAEAAERHLRGALDLRPGWSVAASKLVVVLGAQGRWNEALEVARRARVAGPDDGMNWALTGLAYARLDRWREAESSFRNGLRRMVPAARAPYEDLAGILRTGDRERFEQMGDSARQVMTDLYWELGQPLMINEANEMRTEYYARITYARARWSDPNRGLDGARTERGAVYVRFGPPDVEAVFDRSSVTWVYWTTRLRFAFRMMPGFANARLADVSREVFEQVERDAPGRFDNVPVVRALDTIVTQTVQFRGDTNRTQVAVFGWVPVERMIGGSDLENLALETAAILRNDGGEVQRLRRDETLDPRNAGASQHRTWRLTLPRGEFYLRLEALAPALSKGARHSEILAVRSYDQPFFMMSDVLLARRLAPQDSAPARWTDFFIEPSAGQVEPGEVVSLLWEQYNLTLDAQGAARWHVELRVTVTAVERRDFLARIVGGVGDAVGASALGDDQIALAWDREGRVEPNGTTVEFVTLDFGDAPAGRYEITVAVTDRVSGRTVSRTRTLTRSGDAPER